MPRLAQTPRTSSKADIDQHTNAQSPYSPWCEHCVKGRAKDDCLRTFPGEFADSSVVRVSMDYCFFTEDEKHRETDHVDKATAQVSMTVLVLVETICWSMWAYNVQNKGSAEPSIAKQIL